MRARLRGVLLLAIVVLYGISIPWYREAGAEAPLLFGLPNWVALALGCYAAVALLNALAWLLTDIEDHDEEGSG